MHLLGTAYNLNLTSSGCQKHAVILRKDQLLFFHNSENSDHFVGARLMKTLLFMTESICALSFSHKHAIHCNVH